MEKETILSRYVIAKFHFHVCLAVWFGLRLVHCTLCSGWEGMPAYDEDVRVRGIPPTQIRKLMNLQVRR